MAELVANGHTDRATDDRQYICKEHCTIAMSQQAEKQEANIRDHPFSKLHGQLPDLTKRAGSKQITGVNLLLC